jgi:hypothetical protein
MVSFATASSFNGGGQLTWETNAHTFNSAIHVDVETIRQRNVPHMRY